MKSWFREHFAFFSILIFYLLLFLPVIGQVHLFDWDEINFAEAAREMIVTGDWLNVKINFDPFWEKPPFFIWLQALSMHVFGVTEFAARFPNILVGIVTLCTLYFPILKRYGKQAAIFTILLYLGSFTPHFYFKSGIIDPLFNLFIYIGVLFLVKTIEERKRLNFFFAGLFLGLAVVTKGPVALLLVGLTGLVYQLYYRKDFYSLANLFWLLGGLLLILTIVFGVQVYQMGFWFLKEFIVYQVDLFRNPVASHGQPFYYHFVILLIGCFPLFVIAFSPMIQRFRVSGDITFLRWMKILFWVVLLIFSLVTTKIVHYSSMCYIPLAVLGGVSVSKSSLLPRFGRFVLIVIGVIWIALLSGFGLLSVQFESVKQLIEKFVDDEFLLRQLDTSVEWSFIPLVLAVVFATGLFRYIYKTKKTNLASLLVVNTLVFTLLLSSIVPSIERTIQGEWIKQLKTYQGTEMAHFTLGFKSYAHKYYTAQADFDKMQEAKLRIMRGQNIRELTDLNQTEKKIFDNTLRDYVILSTNLPLSLSVKYQNHWLVEEKYPMLKMVFEGNGYGVWERK